MALDLRLSRARTGVVAMRQDGNNWIPRNWGEKGGKKKEEWCVWEDTTKEAEGLWAGLLTTSLKECSL
jgi:hypothetical protein